MTSAAAQDKDAGLAVAPESYFSSSEESAFTNCRLAHKFQYDLAYGPAVTNSKLSLGIIYHLGFEAIYLEKSDEDVQAIVDAGIQERREELEAAAGPKGVPADMVADFIKDSALVKAMVAGYRPWAIEEGVDDGYETVSVEQPLVVQFPGTDAMFRGKTDLVQRHIKTERLRVVDAKTCKDIAKDTMAFQLSNQNGNYQLAIMAEYGERPTEMVYRQARKMSPKTNPRSKAPYYMEFRIRLTREEMQYRAKQFAMAANAAKDPDRDLYANPGNCCASWKNDWVKPCQLVHTGMDPLEALQACGDFQPRDPDKRYNDLQQGE